MSDSFKKLCAEALGTAALLCAVIGSGIMADQLSGGNVAIALLANTIATVFALFVLIELFAPVSGAHFNPVVSMIMLLRGQLSFSMFVCYVLVQLLGAVLGAWLAHVMFGLKILQWSENIRHGMPVWVSEIVATAGLIFVILNVKSERASMLVAAYIGAAYWFTASTSFANPAAAFGRMFTNTFAGIAPGSVFAFVGAQIIGGLLGYGLSLLLAPKKLSS